MDEINRIFKEAKPGDIFLSQGRGLFSKLICWVLKSKYSHTFVKLSDDSIIEANDVGVMRVDAKKFLSSCLFIENLGFPAGSSTRILFTSNLKFLLGHEYDRGILLGGLLSRIWHRSRRHEGLLNAKDQYTCSELVATALSRCGFILPFPPSQITPEDLYYYITEQSTKHTKKE
ncbi:MAG: hypothetical protein DRH24_13565 [Deltaproteobacteria bacterium]|nr:MAG: hypothetical protein DRH24_13565 [Deltaproteobacteria bacterium]